MITVTKKQAQDRFALISPPLQDAIFSEKTADVISYIQNKYSIPDDITETIAAFTGWVLLGFVRIEDVEKELAALLAMDRKSAAAIASELNEKIFTPLRPAIEASYTISSPNNTAEQKPAPSIIKDIDSAPQTQDQFSTKGWSKISPRDPSIKASVVKLGEKISPVPTPLERLNGAHPVPSPNNKIDGISKNPPTNTSGILAKSSASSITPPPSPVIIQSNIHLNASAKNIDFHIPSPEKDSRVDFAQNTPTPKPASAVVEFGGAHAAAPSVPERPPSKPPLASSPLATSEARKIMEIGAMPDPQLIPKIPIPATPPPPPAPHPTTEAMSHSSMPGYISFSRPATPPPPPAAMPPKPAETIPAVPVPPSPQRPPATPPPSPVRPPATTPTVIVKNFTEGGK